MNIKDYLVEIIDQDNISFSYKVLTEYFELSEKEIEDMIGEKTKPSNVLIVCDRDADFDGDGYVDASSYFLKINDKYFKNSKLGSELWDEVRNLDEYQKKYESY